MPNFLDLETHAGFLKNHVPTFPHFMTYSARLRSYQTWPTSMKITPHVLSVAGFFYFKSGDQTICHHCGGGLKDWQDNDDPWIEHAKWFPKCSYLLAVKGKRFVEQFNTNNSLYNVISHDQSQHDNTPSIQHFEHPHKAVMSVQTHPNEKHSIR